MGKIWNRIGREVPWGVPPLLPAPSVITAQYVLLILGACHTSFLRGDCLGRSTCGGGELMMKIMLFHVLFYSTLLRGFLHWAVPALSIIFEGWKNGRKGGRGKRCNGS